MLYSVDKQTPEICLVAVQQSGFALQYVKEQTPTICLAAVQQNGFALKYVKEQTPELCLAAVQRYGQALEYVNEQSPTICLAAVQQTGFSLYHVKEQTPELCLAAVQQDELSLKYVKIPYKITKSFDTCHTSNGPLKDNTCCICHDDIQEEKKSVVCCLQCKQPFHADCLGDWFDVSKKAVCPICKGGDWKRKVDMTFETV